VAGAVQSFTFGASGNTTQLVQTYAGDPTRTGTQNFTYNALNQPTNPSQPATDQANAAGDQTQTFYAFSEYGASYDAWGRQVRGSAVGAATRRNTAYRYDAYGREIAERTLLPVRPPYGRRALQNLLLATGDGEGEHEDGRLPGVSVLAAILFPDRAQEAHAAFGFPLVRSEVEAMLPTLPSPPTLQPGYGR
jgi:hypothetical protein